jgi:hypothetical protein
VLPALAIVVSLLLAGASPAWAQRDPADDCPAELAAVDASFDETQQRLKSAWESNDDGKKCVAIRHHLEIMRHAGDVFDVCTTGHGREENLGQVIGTIADFEDIASEMGCP